MKRPIWFHRNGPAHWIPCAWPGWALTAVYAAGITVLAVRLAEASKLHSSTPIWGCLAATVALIAVVISTDDTRR